MVLINFIKQLQHQICNTLSTTINISYEPYRFYVSREKHTNHEYDHRRTFIIQQSYFSYQRTSNQEVELQLLNMIDSDQ